MVTPVQRIVHTERLYGMAAFTDENKRQTFDDSVKAHQYLRDGLGSSDEDLGGIQQVWVSVLPQTRRGSLAALSPNQQKRYRGSRQAKEEARQSGMTLEEYYERAPDLKAFRGHASGRPVKVQLTGTYYVTYIDNVTPTGKNRPKASPAKLSKGPHEAARRRIRNERARERRAAARAKR